jgi:hypothetical protein
MTSYHIVSCSTRKRRGMQHVGVWKDGEAKALSAFHSMGAAYAFIAALERVYEGGNELKHGWLFDGVIYRTAKTALAKAGVTVEIRK